MNIFRLSKKNWKNNRRQHQLVSLVWEVCPAVCQEWTKWVLWWNKLCKIHKWDKWLKVWCKTHNTKLWCKIWWDVSVYILWNTDIIMNLAMGMPAPEGADAAMPNLPEAMAGINPRKSLSWSLSLTGCQKSNLNEMFENNENFQRPCKLVWQWLSKWCKRTQRQLSKWDRWWAEWWEVQIQAANRQYNIYLFLTHPELQVNNTNGGRRK